MVFSDTPRVRLDSGGRQFRRRWGYDGSASGCGGGTGPGSLNGGAGHLEDIEEDGDDFSDTYSLRDETSYNSILHEGESTIKILNLDTSFRFFFPTRKKKLVFFLYFWIFVYIIVSRQRTRGVKENSQGLQEEAKSSLHCLKKKERKDTTPFFFFFLLRVFLSSCQQDHFFFPVSPIYLEKKKNWS